MSSTRVSEVKRPMSCDTLKSTGLEFFRAIWMYVNTLFDDAYDIFFVICAFVFVGGNNVWNNFKIFCLRKVLKMNS